ncbi:MAG: fibrobacter succinogenes major paralogous domain-containing protein [Daejeonella sp.]
MKRKQSPIRLLKTVLIFGAALSIFIIVSCKKDKKSTPSNTLKYHGVTYNTIKIGTQTWMVENLRTTQYRGGTYINQDEKPLAAGLWSGASNGAWCKYPNAAEEYGLLYNWHAVNSGADDVKKKLAPTGWHVPTAQDWTILSNFLEGPDKAGPALKEGGTAHWNTDNGSNSSGFAALGGGHSGALDGAFSLLKTKGFWWASDAAIGNANMVYLDDATGKLTFAQYPKGEGFSVRCVKGSDDPVPAAP